MFAPRPVAPASAIEYRPWRPWSWILTAVAAIVAGVIIGVGLTLFYPRGSLAPYEYHLWRYEADNVLGVAFARLGIGPDPAGADGQHALQQYFALTSQIQSASDAEDPDLDLIDTLTNERAAYEIDVERLIQGWIGEAVELEGLQRQLPLFDGVDFTWPPVSIKLTSPPRLLVRSPRDHIQRLGDTLLKSGLSLRDIEKIEGETTKDDTVTLVVSLGGIAAYPAIVENDRSYDAVIDTASHEWVHHYLAFFPLGEQWGKGGDAETLNETTANIAGREIANIIRKMHPVSFPSGEDGSLPPQPAPTVDFSKEMRDLRLQVDALLKDGKVTEAETAMDEKRDFLAQHGIYIRKINQAYFAFYGTYADTAASSNPVGPKIEQVWSLTKDVGAFLKVMREVKNTAGLDHAIAVLQAAQSSP